MQARKPIIAMLSAIVSVAALGGIGPADAASTSCRAMSRTVYQLVNPTTSASFTTTSASAASAAQNRGMQRLDPGFKASARKRGALVAYYRLTSSNRELIVRKGATYKKALRHGFRSRGVVFYASPRRLGCTSPIKRLVKGNVQRLANSALASELIAKGWTVSGSLWAVASTDPAPGNDPDVSTSAPATAPTLTPIPTPSPSTTPTPTPTSTTGPVGKTFSIAVLPDTQNTVQDDANAVSVPRHDFADEVKWLVDNQSTLNLKYVIQTGDLVNVSRDKNGWYNDKQYKVAAAGLRQLSNAGIPYSLTVGNHDGAAVCNNGNNCAAETGNPAENARTNIRDTGYLNQYFPYTEHISGGGDAYIDPWVPSHVRTSTTDPAAWYYNYDTSGTKRVDNSYQRFTVDGVNFLVLTLEFMPRQGAIDWAKGVIQAHPSDNILITTHAYTDQSGKVETGNDGYGDKTPMDIYNTLVAPFSNVKMVFSGHVGGNAAFTYNTGDAAPTYGINNVQNYMGCFHLRNGDPIRILTINTTTGQTTSRFVTPDDPAGLTAAYQDLSTSAVTSLVLP